MMSSTKEQARRRDYYYNDPQRRRHFGDNSDSWFGDGSDPYEYFNSIQHLIKSEGEKKLFDDFKESRPKAAAFLELAFGDMAKNVFQYFPPDISEAKCILLAAQLSKPKDIDDSRAVNSLDSHIEEL